MASKVGIWSTPNEDERLAKKAEERANPPAPEPQLALPPEPVAPPPPPAPVHLEVQRFRDMLGQDPNLAPLNAGEFDKQNPLGDEVWAPPTESPVAPGADLMGQPPLAPPVPEMPGAPPMDSVLPPQNNVVNPEVEKFRQLMAQEFSPEQKEVVNTEPYPARPPQVSDVQRPMPPETGPAQVPSQPVQLNSQDELAKFRQIMGISTQPAQPEPWEVQAARPYPGNAREVLDLENMGRGRSGGDVTDEFPAPPDDQRLLPNPQSNNIRYSPYDELWDKYAGDLVGNSEFKAIVSAAAKAESGFNPNAIGDGGRSIGLFQMHERGAGKGYSANQRANPELQARVMVPQFAAKYKELRAQGLAGAELASAVARAVERPQGFEDPNGKAAMSYKRAWADLTGGYFGPSKSFVNEYRTGPLGEELAKIPSAITSKDVGLLADIPFLGDLAKSLVQIIPTPIQGGVRGISQASDIADRALRQQISNLLGNWHTMITDDPMIRRVNEEQGPDAAWNYVKEQKLAALPEQLRPVAATAFGVAEGLPSFVSPVAAGKATLPKALRVIASVIDVGTSGVFAPLSAAQDLKALRGTGWGQAPEGVGAGLHPFQTLLNDIDSGTNPEKLRVKIENALADQGISFSLRSPTADLVARMREEMNPAAGASLNSEIDDASKAAIDAFDKGNDITRPMINLVNAMTRNGQDASELIKLAKNYNDGVSVSSDNLRAAISGSGPRTPEDQLRQRVGESLPTAGQGRQPPRPPRPPATSSPPPDDFATRLRAQIEELDNRGAPDAEYRSLLSTGSRTKGRFKTWRKKALSFSKTDESSIPGLAESSARAQAGEPLEQLAADADMDAPSVRGPNRNADNPLHIRHSDAWTNFAARLSGREIHNIINSLEGFLYEGASSGRNERIQNWIDDLGSQYGTDIPWLTRRAREELGQEERTSIIKNEDLQSNIDHVWDTLEQQRRPLGGGERRQQGPHPAPFGQVPDLEPAPEVPATGAVQSPREPPTPPPTGLPEEPPARKKRSVSDETKKKISEALTKKRTAAREGGEEAPEKLPDDYNGVVQEDMWEPPVPVEGEIKEVRNVPTHGIPRMDDLPNARNQRTKITEPGESEGGHRVKFTGIPEWANPRMREETLPGMEEFDPRRGRFYEEMPTNPPEGGPIKPERDQLELKGMQDLEPLFQTPPGRGKVPSETPIPERPLSARYNNPRPDSFPQRLQKALSRFEETSFGTQRFSEEEQLAARTELAESVFDAGNVGSGEPGARFIHLLNSAMHVKAAQRLERSLRETVALIRGHNKEAGGLLKRLGDGFNPSDKTTARQLSKLRDVLERDLRGWQERAHKPLESRPSTQRHPFGITADETSGADLADYVRVEDAELLLTTIRKIEAALAGPIPREEQAELIKAIKAIGETYDPVQREFSARVNIARIANLVRSPVGEAADAQEKLARLIANQGEIMSEIPFADLTDDRAVEFLNRILLQKGGFRAWLETAQDFRAASLLSSTGTFMINAIGNLPEWTLGFPRSVFESKALGATWRESWDDAKAGYSTMGATFRQATLDARKTMDTGISTAHERDLGRRAANLDPRELRQVVQDAVKFYDPRHWGSGGELVFRAMAAADDLWRIPQFNGILMVEARREARKLGTDWEDIITNLWDHPEVFDRAEHEALKRVYQAPLDEGSFWGKLDNFRRTPIMREFIPFLHTLANMSKLAAETLPPIEAVKAMRATDPIERAQHVANLALFAPLYGGLAFLVSSNLVTGFGPPEGRDRDAWLEHNAPFSVRTPAGWVPLEIFGRLGIVGGHLATSMDSMRYGQLKYAEDHELDRAAYEVVKDSLAGSGRFLLSTGGMRGLNDLWSAIFLMQADRMVEGLALSHGPFVGMSTALTRGLDDVPRNPESVGDAIRNRYLMSGEVLGQEGLPVARTRWGEEIPNVSGLAALTPISRVRTPYDDVVRQEVDRLQRRGLDVAPGFVGRDLSPVKGGKVRLTEDERSQLQQLSGEMSHDMLMSIMGSASWDALPDAGKAAIIKSVVERSRTYAQRTLMSQRPQLIERSVKERETVVGRGI